MDPPDVLYRPVDYFGDDEAAAGVDDLSASNGDTSTTAAINATAASVTAAPDARIGDPLLPIALIICILLISAFFGIWSFLKSRQRVPVLLGSHRTRYGIVTPSVATEPVGASVKTVRSSGTGSKKGSGGVAVVSAAPVTFIVN